MKDERMFSDELINSCVCNDLIYYDWEINKQNYILIDGNAWKVHLDYNGVVIFAYLK